MSNQAVLVSRDLFFITKVKEVALAASCNVLTVKSEQAWESQLKDCLEGQATPGVVLLDLEKAGMPLASLVTGARRLAERGWRCIGFYSHVHADVEQEARGLGLEEVMPRSRFVKILPELLAGLCCLIFSLPCNLPV